MKTILLFGLLWMSFLHSASAQDFELDMLDKYFDTLEVHDKFMGNVAVAKGGDIIYTRALGYSDVEKERKADQASRYRIGSISKTFTAVLVMRAMEEGYLDLDQTIEKYFPTIENADQITLRHLLSHRSGIHNFTNDADYVTYYTQPKTESEMVDIIAKAGSDWAPDSKAEYSNSNYVLLSYILEREMGKSYALLLEDYIIKPIGLENTSFGGPIDTEKNECKSYRFIGNWIPAPETDISIPLGAGGVVSTATDLTKFSDALFDGKLLRPGSLEMMKTIEEGYGLGLFQIPFYEKRGFGHTGGIDGFSSVFSYFPEDSISYALVSNGANYANNDISIAVLSAVYGKSFELPDFSSYAIDPAELDQYLGHYTSAQMPLEITVTKEGSTLYAQATGQPSFPLEAIGENRFQYKQAGLEMEFNPEEDSFILKQGGNQLFYTKENKE